MGYTHYWQQFKAFRLKPSDDIEKPPCWSETAEHIRAILNDAQHVQGIALANGGGEPGSQPEFSADRIWFNGVGPDDDHETFAIWRQRQPLESWQGKSDRGRDFCKTARKPYDLAVTACLAYLAAVHGWHVSSDGNAFEWLEGVELARRVLPRFANQIDIPMPILRSERWDWRDRAGRSDSKRYDLQTCIDGHVYVFERNNETNCYRFDTVDEARAYLRRFREPTIEVRWQGYPASREGGQPVFETSGSYDKRRHAQIERIQNRVLKRLIDAAPTLGRNIPPPKFARPKAMVKPERDMADTSSLFDLVA